MVGWLGALGSVGQALGGVGQMYGAISQGRMAKKMLANEQRQWNDWRNQLQKNENALSEGANQAFNLDGTPKKRRPIARLGESVGGENVALY